jgi:16S rRNA (cytosine967-C5)-methyltransferase
VQERPHALPSVETARTAREVALEVLHRVDADRAWSGTLLRRLLWRARLTPADGALVTELTYGTLRHQAAVDWALSRFTRTPLEELPSRIRAVLRLGAYQILFLSRIPPSAAVWEAVELAKHVGHAGTARLVNAVLRRLAAAPPDLPDDRGTVAGIALRYSHPAWLVARWAERFGVAETRALCEANNRTPPSAIRLNTLRGTTEEVAARLAEMGIETRPSAFLPEGRRITAGPPGARQQAYDAGWYAPQDEGSMLVALLVSPRPGETVIDTCAAPGGKTTHMAALMENRGRLVACDVRPEKLLAVSRQCARLGVTIVETRDLDAVRVGAEYPDAADRVLVDAPCSGLGVVRRRPEIKWRLRPEHLAPLAARQRRLLWGAAGAVRRGGVLVYSVCTCEPEEGPAVVEAFLAEHREFAPLVIAGWPPGAGARGDGARDRVVFAPAGAAFLYPHRTDTDGFFVAALRRAA